MGATSMNPAIVIRDETDADVSTITEVTVAAFKANGRQGAAEEG